MASYQQLNDEIICIDTEQHRPHLAACYLIGSDGHYAFVEAGTSPSLPLLLQALDALGVARSAVDYVMPTHVHLDHAGGAGALIRALPNARLVIHPRGARHMIDPSKLIAGATAVYGEATMRELYGEIVPVPESRVVIADVAADRDFALTLGSRRLEFIDSPGHARHHYAIWDAQTRGWFSGDVFGLSYRELDDEHGPYMMPTTSPVQFDPAAWQVSLQRLVAKSPEHVYLTHYSRIDEIEKLAGDLRVGLAAYQRIAEDSAGAPDRHARIVKRLTDFHLDQLHARRTRVTDAQAREVIAIDVEISAQGLEVWLDRVAQAGHGNRGSAEPRTV